MRLLLAALGLWLIAASAQAQTALQPQASTAIEGHHTFCQGPCSLATVTLTTGASSGFLMIFDASSDPADGTVTPKYCWPWPANYGSSFSWPFPAKMLNGLVIVFSVGANCVTKTESATAFFSSQVTP